MFRLKTMQRRTTSTRSSLPPVDDNPFPLPPVDDNPLALLPVDDNAFALPPVDDNALPPVDDNPLALLPVDDNPLALLPVDDNPLALPPLDDNALPPVDDNPFALPPVDDNALPPVEDNPFALPPVDDNPFAPSAAPTITSPPVDDQSFSPFASVSTVSTDAATLPDTMFALFQKVFDRMDSLEKKFESTAKKFESTAAVAATSTSSNITAATNKAISVTSTSNNISPATNNAIAVASSTAATNNAITVASPAANRPNNISAATTNDAATTASTGVTSAFTLNNISAATNNAITVASPIANRPAYTSNNISATAPNNAATTASTAVTPASTSNSTAHNAASNSHRATSTTARNHSGTFAVPRKRAGVLPDGEPRKRASATGARISLHDLKRILHAHPTTATSSIYNLGFVFEVGTDQFAHQDRSRRLTELGFFAEERLGHMKEIHFLWPSQFQSYHARHGQDPHGQCLFAEFVSGLYSFQGEIFVYFPNTNYSNHFLLVDNNSAVSRGVDWNFVDDAIPHIQKMATTYQRQAEFRDFGRCTWLSSSRVGGVAEPNQKPGTNHPGAKVIFATMEAFKASSRPLWYKEEGNGRPVDYVRLSRTSSFKRCGLHRDNLSNSVDYPDVLCVSTIRNGRRLSFNAQQKKSMDQLGQKVEATRDLMGDILRLYNGVPATRKQVCLGLLDGETVNFEGYTLVSNHCNMDPLSYGQPVLLAIARLMHHFDLNLVEIHSVHLASCFVPECKIFFSIAADMLMSLQIEELRAGDTGVFLGRLLALLSIQVQKAYQSKKRVDIRRYPKRVSPEVLSRNSWAEIVRYHAVLCLHVWKGHSKCPKSQRNAVYDDVVARLVHVYGMGLLVGNHLIGEKACLGLLPAWMREHAKISDNSKAVVFFKYRYGDSKHLKGEGLRRFSSDVAATIADRFGHLTSLRKVENIFCKVYRLLNKGDSLWKDVLHYEQPVFRFPNEKICEVLTRDGNFSLDGGFVLNLFPYGNGFESMDGIIERLHMVATIPDDCTLKRFNLPRELLHPSVEVNLEFHLGSLEGKQSIIANRFTSMMLQRVGY
jgi:hypothetical protein